MTGTETTPAGLADSKLGGIRAGHVGGNQMLRYKVVEVPVVTDEALENALNEWAMQGWQFDSLQFVVREASKRPSMAFLLFTRQDAAPA